MQGAGSNNADLYALIQGCKDHSGRHKEALYKSYYGYLKSVVLRYVHDVHVVEELVNDSFIKIFNGIGSFQYNHSTTDLHRSFKGWIARIASNTSIDFLRKKRPEFPTDQIIETDNEHTITTQTNNNEVKEILNLLNQLPETQKMVFNLYELEGLRHDEIAGILSIPENVCRVYLSRAKKQLKTLYLKAFNI